MAAKSRLSGAGAGPDRSAPITVLIVDDEPFFLSATTRILREAGFGVYTCGLWAEASSLVRQVEPDVVLLGLNLASISSGELCSILKQRIGPGIKVVLFSIESEDVLRRVSAECGADGYIRKAVQPRELIEKLRAVAAADDGAPVR